MSIQVLLADDNEMMRRMIRRILEEDPEIQLVGESVSLSQTVQMTGELQPDVVILDLHMGDEKGTPPSHVKSLLAGSQVLAISIWNDDETEALAYSFGAVTLLDKGSLGTELVSAIKQYADNYGESTPDRGNAMEAD